MKDAKKWIITAISVFLMFGCEYLPPMFGLSSLGMEVAGIFIGTILLWMFVSVNWPSLLCIVALIMSPLYTYSDALKGSMGGWITSFVLFSSMVTYTLGQTGFLKRCAVWFVTRPFSKRNPWLFLALLFLAPLAIGSFMSPIPAFIVCLPIAEQIFAELKYEKGDRLPQIVVLGILFFASLSTAATPIAHTVTTMALSLYENESGNAINFVGYTVFGVISCLVIFAGIAAHPLCMQAGYEPPAQSGQQHSGRKNRNDSAGKAHPACIFACGGHVAAARFDLGRCPCRRQGHFEPWHPHPRSDRRDPFVHDPGGGQAPDELW